MIPIGAYDVDEHDSVYNFNYGSNFPAHDIDILPTIGTVTGQAAGMATGSALQTSMVKKLAFGAVALFLVSRVL